MASLALMPPHSLQCRNRNRNQPLLLLFLDLTNVGSLCSFSVCCELEARAVVQEIEERKEFLEAMRQAGKGKEYEALMKAQISERVAEMKALDKQEQHV